MKEIKLQSYTCNKCDYKWYPRIEKKPKQCPYCKQLDWDKEKIK
jgi:predicted Zn-ribbon and HTH transcriptional regulator